MNLLDLIAGAGNLLDLPGSSVRDLLTGRNPFDQWATPFSSDNRASGRDVLQPLLGANKETGISGWLSDPVEGLKDIAGFGAELITDPMNLIPAGWFGKVLSGRKATRAANAAVKAERGGKYSFVNPKLLSRTADDSVKPVAQVLSRQNPMAAVNVVDPALTAVTGQNPMKLLEYSPPRETVYHGGWDWSPTATPEHPYGMFDINRVGTGEGAQAYGPGMYLADDASTSKRYQRIAQDRMESEALGPRTDRMARYFEPGRVIKNSSGGMDRVISFNPTSHDWGVKVQAVKLNDAGEYVPAGPIRDHGTAPTNDEMYASLGIPKPEAKLYELDMPHGTKSKFLDWNNPISHQPPGVVGILSEVGDRVSKAVAEHLQVLGPVKGVFEQAAESIRGIEKQIADTHGLPFEEVLDVLHKDPSKPLFFRSQKALDVAKQFPEYKAEYEKLSAAQDEASRITRDVWERVSNELGLSVDTVADLSRGILNDELTGESLAEIAMGVHPSYAGFDQVSTLKKAGVPGTKNRASSTGRRSHNYALWDQDLLKQMRVRAINGQRVPINPTTLVQRIEQPLQRAGVADTPLMSNMNPMNLQTPPSAVNPVALALLQNLLSRNDNWIGGNR